ncbi:nitrite reductase [Cohnella luojiensis]|uniref:Nitrite reductase n=1 Tax=Cohnella luojiensis TaxID=652876 RepID=A0A4Y8LZU3_9BACL|nr:nitrite reductase [Cohnella luojiensis]TFE24959.1 nitrite reductase [Cohnella luojiensis]
MKIAVAPRIGVGGSLFTAEQWKSIGDVLHADAKIEFTTFKQLYIDIEEDHFDETKEKLVEAGLEVYPTGFFSKNLIACNFCRGAEEAGLSVALKLNEIVAGHAVPSPLKVGYAGCANATSEPLFKDIGIVKMKAGFNIYVGGEGKSIKASLAQILFENVQEIQLIPIVERLISYYQQNGKTKERYSRFVQRMTLERLKEEIIS